MPGIIFAPLDSASASFRTHFNYVKCLERLLSHSTLSSRRLGKPKIDQERYNQFRKLYKITLKSIEKDIELAKEDISFAVIAAPWFPVKCYYALYYLESILIHLVNGNTAGFTKGGHKGVRKAMGILLENGTVAFTQKDLSAVYALKQIEVFPPILPGRNAKQSYWAEAVCINSVLKKLMEYKLHDAPQQWNLRTKKGKDEKALLLIREKLTMIDFFYWYRIKANYRDLDYIDFESGVSEEQVFEYIMCYYNAFDKYRNQLVENINSLPKK